MPFAGNRCRIYYELSGRAGAPALVLIRGLGRSGRYWGGFRDLLEPWLQLVVVDNRGVGRSDAPPPPYSTAGMADDIARVLDDARIPRAHVCGLSLGGMIAQRFAVRHASRVDRLVLGATTHGGRRAVRPSRRASLALARSSRLPPADAVRTIAPYLLSEATLSERPEVLDQWIAAASEEGRSMLGLLGQVAAVFRHDARRDLRHIRAPTLVVTGDADRLIPSANSRLLADRIAGAELVELPGAGHDLTAERPRELAAALERFLDLPAQPTTSSA